MNKEISCLQPTGNTMAEKGQNSHSKIFHWEIGRIANMPPSQLARIEKNTTLAVEDIPGLAPLEPLGLLSGRIRPSIFWDPWLFLLRKLPMSTIISGHTEVGPGGYDLVGACTAFTAHFQLGTSS